ncbi:RluA family pseudouridine synthase [Lapidilactobacillus wuchangensis]|uniref:RluA family pseudouridine synthase n=1 Tax=Lapidilactobacillus wuchangensis TaxID=2486001 RepID=UPI000F77F049|nr:RluA family pseudouridine synthase [Lapidilactobacillus wuchangensis]
MKTKFVFILPADFKPRTVRQLLQSWLIPKKWQHFLRIEQKILVNGVYRSFHLPVYGQDTISLDFSFLANQAQTYLPSAGALPIIYENDDLLVINKPAGIKSHPNRTAETGTVLNILTQQLAVPPLMVHRIDEQTSGALLVAKTPVVVPILDRELSQKTMGRDYLAWVTKLRTEPLADSGEINLPIGRDDTDQRKRKIDWQAGQNARTQYQILQQDQQQALIHLHLLTGRTHQIRVHLAALQLPIVGDPLYNPTAMPDQKMLLHGYQLFFKQPFTGEPVTVLAPLPDYFPRAAMINKELAQNKI